MILARLALTSLAFFAAAVAAAAPRLDDFTLDLGGVRFDPADQAPAALLPADWRLGGELGRLADADTFLLVQLPGPTREADLARLRATGLELVQYVHPFTYIVWGRPAHLESLEGARWKGAFEPAYKVQPRSRRLGDAVVELDALVWAPAADAARAALRHLGARVDGEARLDHRFVHLTLRLAGSALAEAARIPGVYTLQPEPKDGGLRGELTGQINAGNLDLNGLAVPGYQAWLAGIGLDGAGVVIANVDSGVQNDHPDLVNRLVACSGTTCGGATSSQHGTHTAGIMAADGSSGTSLNGFLRGLGVAPGANLVEQRSFPFYTQPGGMRLLMEESWENGARLSGNSWGPSGSPLGYDNDTLQVDLGVRDADDDQPGNQPFSYILSIMNGNGGTSTQGTPDEAKNCFTVGSTRAQVAGGAQEPNINDISANSAHGPALDGRKIPHIVAPGCRVDSSVSGSTYGFLCGTSMASPQVTGAVALFFEYYRGLFGVDPSPAMVKAAFLPVAKDLASFNDANGFPLGHRFDFKQGWGRMDLGAVVAPTLPVIYRDNPLVLQATGESWSQTVRVANNQYPIKVMLVWTDAAGHGLGGSTPAWNNDLDLSVTWDGNTYLGNVFDDAGNSTTGGAGDDRNNTEGFFLPAGVSGSVVIQVTAANLTSDGIPGEGDAADQDFALVCYNCLAADFLFADGFESGDTSAW